MVVEIMKEELLGKIVETRDGQKWFVVKLNDKYMAFNENFYTAPASISGLPAVVAGGVQLIGKAFDDGRLLNLAETEGEF